MRGLATATGNFERHASTEKRWSVSIGSAATPINVAPFFLNASLASANIFVSIVQPAVNAAGKKYSTTGPRLSACDSENWNVLPPIDPCVEKSGAADPTFSAAVAGTAASNASSARTGRIIDDLQ